MDILKKPVFLLRIGLGWIFLYAGLSHLFTPGWTAAGYLSGATSFGAFYAWLASPAMLPFINFVNVWALTLLGASLILGMFVRLSSILGAALMILYYLPILHFPFVGKNALLIDEHVIYILILCLFAEQRAGRVKGLDGTYAKKYWPKLG